MKKTKRLLSLVIMLTMIIFNGSFLYVFAEGEEALAAEPAPVAENAEENQLETPAGADVEKPEAMAGQEQPASEVEKAEEASTVTDILPAVSAGSTEGAASEGNSGSGDVKAPEDNTADTGDSISGSNKPTDGTSANADSTEGGSTKDSGTEPARAVVILADNLSEEIKAASEEGIQPGSGPITLTITKEWDDNGNEAGLRPESITVTLYQYTEGQEPTEGTPIGDPITLSGSGDVWTGTIDITEHIINAQESTQYKYAFVEDENEIKAYSYSEDADSHEDPDVFFEFEDVVNWEHNPQPEDKPVKTDISVNNRSIVAMKSTANGHDGVIIWTPEALTPFEQDIIVSTLPTYIGSTNVLFVYGTSGTYIVEGHSEHIFSIVDNEIIFGDGIVQAAQGTYNRSTPEQLTGKIVNVVETTTATIRKIWDDADNQDGKRPSELKVTLSNGTEVTLNEDNEWTATVDNLPKFDEKGDITYSWTEDESSLPEGYELTGTETSDTTTTLTNSYTPETITLSGIKEWVDGNNQDGIRPGSVTVKITGSDGNEYTVETDAYWKWSIDGIPKYTAGQVGVEVEYTISEISIDGYTSEIVDNGDGTYTITNTHIPEKISISGNKVWDDKDDKDGIRPGSITVRITGSDGKEYTATTDADWNWVVNDLPKYADGEEIEYTVSEMSINGYTCQIVKNEDGTYTITNTHTPEEDPAPEPEPEPTPDDPDNPDNPSDDPTVNPSDDPSVNPSDDPSDSPSDNATPQSNAVATGDNSNIVTYFIMMTVSMVAAAGIIILRRKQN